MEVSDRSRKSKKNISCDLFLELKKSTPDEFTRKTYKNVAKEIWKERCKERERCPRCGIIMLFCDETVRPL
jgi:hypothetical protein